MGCIKHPHGKYISYAKIYAIPMSVEEQAVEPDVFSFELLNSNSSRFSKIQEIEGQYLYENTVYLDRFVHITGIEVIAKSEITNVKINDFDETTFSKAESLNKINVKALIISEGIPSDIITVNIQTVREIQGL
jgi:hypothetical protein